MKYIRTKDGCITEGNFEIGKTIATLYGDEQITKENTADTIEELIQDNDILYIHDLYPDAVLVVEGNIKPFGYQSAIELKKWLEYKTKFDLYIRDNKGNYILVAKMNESGVLELL